MPASSIPASEVSAATESQPDSSEELRGSASAELTAGVAPAAGKGPATFPSKATGQETAEPPSRDYDAARNFRGRADLPGALSTDESSPAIDGQRTPIPPGDRISERGGAAPKSIPAKLEQRLPSEQKLSGGAVEESLILPGRAGNRAEISRDINPTIQLPIDASSGAPRRAARADARPQPAPGVASKVDALGSLSDGKAAMPPRETPSGNFAGMGSGRADGTGSAEISQLMKNLEEMDRASGRSEKTLPTSARLGTESADNATLARLPVGAKSDSHSRGLSPVAISDGVYLSDLTTRTVTGDAQEVNRVAPKGIGMSLESVHQRILEGVVELRRTQADALTVVIKPNAETELSVLVQLRNGMIEVDAQCRRGESHAWMAQWGQLQQTLSLQGIRLGDLQDATPSTEGDLMMGQGHSNQPDDGPYSLTSDRPLSKTINLKKQPAPDPQPEALAVNGSPHWESWA